MGGRASHAVRGAVVMGAASDDEEMNGPQSCCDTSRVFGDSQERAL